LMKHLNIHIKGWVQGVGYRYSALKAARSFGINGFVRNETDGSVYIEAEGDELNLGLFMDWCRRGPSFGRVDEVTQTESGLRGFDEFRILH
jgi:acylphosphatase